MKRILIAAFVSLLFFGPGVATAEEQSVRLFLGDDCEGCDEFILEALARNDGVTLVEIDYDNEWILVRFDDAVGTISALVDTLRMFGYRPEVWLGDGI